MAKAIVPIGDAEGGHPEGQELLSDSVLMNISSQAPILL